MADASSAHKIDLNLVTRIVRSYVVQNRIDANQLAGLIAEVHRSLSGLGREVLLEEPLVPAVSVRQSVRRDYVVCLERGFHGQTIRRHLSVGHGLTPEQYRLRWKIASRPPDHRPGLFRATLGDGKANWPRQRAQTIPGQLADPATRPRRRGRPRRSP